ncbi:MAG: hypothetical protein A3F26_02195 [Candidatus Ryanbacteria bacterium RIFCSPHIGHO2_12_FULL_47_12b]|nr:MAG: hypothetical protein A3F26_02195 [Candidatus Ryanbacteria bacterium RIFCSPHIGHO2_12_FULL_47_12b]
MNRVLGIDYGTSRIGLALSDERGKIAFPHKVIIVRKKLIGEIIKKLREICIKESVSEIVVGLPRGLSGMQDTEMTKSVREFADALAALHLPVHLEEEFLSTKEASRGPTAKSHIDASAAAIILQSFLDSQKDL